MTFRRAGLFAVLVPALCLAAGCNYQVKKTGGLGGGVGGGSTSKPEVAIYFADVQPILDRSCVKCHDELATYAEVMGSGTVVAGNAARSELFTRLKNNPGGDMPKRANALSDADAALIRDWINGGALLGEPADAPAPTEPAPAPVPPADPVPSLATYTELQAQVFAKKCTMCHGDTSDAAGFSLEHYDAIVANPRLIVKGNAEQSGLYVSVAGDDAFMPPKRAVTSGRVQALTQEEKDALKAWIDAGAPQN